MMAEASVVSEALAVAAQRVSAMHHVTRGGLLERLLEIAHLSGVGIEIDISRLPHRSVVSGFAQAFQFDPLRMISSRTLALTIPPQRVDDVSQALKEVGTPFAFVGQVTEGVGVGVLLQDGETVHPTEIQCEEDELARRWGLYARDE